MLATRRLTPPTPRAYSEKSNVPNASTHFLAPVLGNLCSTPSRLPHTKAKAPRLPDEDIAQQCELPATDAAELTAQARALAHAGDLHSAAACAAKAVRSEPTSPLGWADLATAWQHSNRGRALEYLEHAAKLEPTAEFYNQLGVLQRTSLLPDEAISSFKSATRLEPESATAHFHLGGSLEAAGRLEEALTSYRRALDLESSENEARIHNNIGGVLGRLGRTREALRAYAEAEEADPAFPETQWNLAALNMELGNLPKARKHLEGARKLAPDDVRLDAKEGELDKKEKDARLWRARDEVDRRDAGLSRDERVERMRLAMEKCGGPSNPKCLKEYLGQSDLGDDIMPIF